MIASRWRSVEGPVNPGIGIVITRFTVVFPTNFNKSAAIIVNGVPVISALFDTANGSTSFDPILVRPGDYLRLELPAFTTCTVQGYTVDASDLSL